MKDRDESERRKAIRGVGWGGVVEDSSGGRRDSRGMSRRTLGQILGLARSSESWSPSVAVLEPNYNDEKNVDNLI